MSVQLTIRVAPELSEFIDAAVESGEGSRADVINHALRQEVRRRAAMRDANIYASTADPDLESDAYLAWAEDNAGDVWAELD